VAEVSTRIDMAMVLMPNNMAAMFSHMTARLFHRDE